MSGPIKPSEVVSLKERVTPEQVFEAFNETIAKHWTGHSSRFGQDEIIAAIESKMVEQNIRRRIFDEHWMDVEPIYRAAGWDVEYNKPGYNESYEANWTFEKKK